jgi:hypothetical protein
MPCLPGPFAVATARQEKFSSYGPVCRCLSLYLVWPPESCHIREEMYENASRSIR